MHNINGAMVAFGKSDFLEILKMELTVLQERILNL